MTLRSKVIPLGELAAFRSGGTPSKSRHDYWGGDFPWVSAKDLKIPIITNALDCLSVAGFAAAHVAPKNSLLILVRGMTLFKDVPVCLAGRDVAFNQDIKALVVSKAVAPQYLLFFLLSQKNKLLDLVDSAGHGTGRLDTDSLKAFPVIVPPLPEQRTIAALLSTWDAAIEKTERLIATKEKQYRGLVQNLIGEECRRWKHLRADNIFKSVSERGNGSAELLSVTQDQGVIPRAMLSIAVIGIRDGKQISIPDFMSVKLPYPPLKQQQQISSVLNTAHHEIDLLKKQAEAYRTQKRGLMQKLLTGEWRVKATEDKRWQKN